MRKTLLFNMLLALSIPHMQAQDLTVSGKVSSQEDGTGIPGVNIIVKGTTTGTTTDADGNYRISLAQPNVVLIFSSIGYVPEEIAVNGRSVIDITLVRDITSLEEVVVVAFGEAEKATITGALESIKSEDIVRQQQANISNSIQGLAPGLQVIEGNGQPGSSGSFLIRGIGSLQAGTGPLIVVDGAVFSGELSQLNASDIESVNVLKDASAAALYGSRAGNGVVLITTKKGENQPTSYNISAQYGITRNNNPNDFRVMNTEEYVEYYREAIINTGEDPDDPGTGFFMPVDQPFNTNWVDEALQTGSFNKYDFSARGGNGKTAFFTALGYLYQEGTVVETDFERVTGTVNLDHQANDKFDLGGKIQLAYESSNNLISEGGRSGQLSGAFQTAPIEPIFVTPDLVGGPFDGAGFNFDIPSNAQHNPVATAVMNSNTTETWNMNSNFDLGYNFTPEIRGEVLANYYFFSTNTKETIGKLYKAETDGGTTGEGRITGNTFNFISTLAYRKVIQNHGFGLKIGFETTRQRLNSLDVSADNFTFSNLNAVGFGNVVVAQRINSGFEGSSLAGFFGRVNYSFRDKLFVEGSLRRDGASNFGPDTRWGTFGAVGISYLLSEEQFVKDLPFLDNLKLRLSYGSSGNNQIGDFSWRDLYRADVIFTTGPGPNNANNGVGTSFPANPDLRWEKNLQFDLGVDFAMFNNKISGSVDYFRRVSQDLLFNSPLSQTTGFNSVTVNSGAELLNTGVEVSLGLFPVRSDNFLWQVNANFAIYNQEITTIPDDVVFSTNIWQEGGRSDHWYLQRYAGVDPANGDALYLTADGETTTDYNGDEDRVITGQRTPDTYGGITNTFEYKGISLSFMIYYSFGADEYFDLGQDLSTDGANFPANQWVRVLNRWQNPGDITDTPRPLVNNPNGDLVSTRYLYDASFVRLQNVSLGYRLPTALVEKLGMNDISVSLNGQNLWLTTDFPGFDPTSESYPLPRTITLGVNLSF